MVAARGSTTMECELCAAVRGQECPENFGASPDLLASGGAAHIVMYLILQCPLDLPTITCQAEGWPV